MDLGEVVEKVVIMVQSIEAEHPGLSTQEWNDLAQIIILMLTRNTTFSSIDEFGIRESIQILSRVSADSIRDVWTVQDKLDFIVPLVRLGSIAAVPIVLPVVVPFVTGVAVPILVKVVIVFCWSEIVTRLILKEKHEGPDAEDDVDLD